MLSSSGRVPATRERQVVRPLPPYEPFSHGTANHRAVRSDPIMPDMWISACDNPRALERLYGSTEGLESVDLHEVVLHRDGPRLVLRFDLPRFPDRPVPPRWSPAANVLQAEVSFWGVADLRLAGWTPGGRGVLAATTAGNENQVTFTSEGVELRANFRTAHLDGLSAYTNEERES